MIRPRPERLNDLAVTYRAKPTAVDHALEYVAHGREVDELAFDAPLARNQVVAKQ